MLFCNGVNKMSAIRRKKKNYNLGYHEVSKITILKRLDAFGFYTAARQALLQQDQLTQDLWNAAQVIRSNDRVVRTLLTSIGADPEQILAKE